MPQRSDRIQREVDELLAKLEQFPPKRPLSRRLADALTAPFRSVGSAFSHLPRINPGHILLAAITVIVIAYLAGGASGIWTWIIVLGIFAFIFAFIASLRRQSRPPSPKYWRDRPIDLSGRNQGKSFWDRFRGR